MWNLYHQAKRVSASPSELLGLNRRRNPWLCWQFDNAIDHFGSVIEGELHSIKLPAESKEAREAERRERKLRRLRENHLRQRLGIHVTDLPGANLSEMAAIPGGRVQRVPKRSL